MKTFKGPILALSATALLWSTASGVAWAADETVTIVLPGGPDRLDPCETPRSVIGRIIKQNVVETLVELDYANHTVQPRLATGWTQVSPTEMALRPARRRDLPRRHAPSTRPRWSIRWSGCWTRR